MSEIAVTSTAADNEVMCIIACIITCTLDGVVTVLDFPGLIAGTAI